MRRPLPAVASIRDFYAFEQHVATCRRHRGLDMVPEWYRGAGLLLLQPGRRRSATTSRVSAPRGSQALDYELELACVIGQRGRDLPADDRALECVAGFTIMNDWSARDLQRVEMAVGLGPSKGKDFATSLGPELVTLRRAGRPLPRRPAAPGDDRRGQRPRCSRAATPASMYWTWPQLLAHASRDTTLRPGDVLGSGTVGTGCILELTPEAVGGWLKPGDVVELTDRAAWDPAANPRSSGTDPRRSLIRIRQECTHASLSADSARSPASGTSPTATSPGYKGEGIYYEEVVTSPGSPGLQHRLSPAARRRACARSSRPGRSTLELVDEPALRHHHLKTRSHPPRRRPDHRPRAPARQRRRDPWPAAGPSEPQDELYRNADADEVIFVHSRPGHAAHACSARCPSATSTTSSSPAARPTGSSSTRRPRPTCSSSRRPATSTIPPRYLNPDGQLRLGAPYGERDLHGPREIARHRPRGGDDRCSIKDGTPADALHAGAPSLRRRRLGRDGLPVHVQRRRLRADHRHGPPAAAGAADVRGPRVRRLHVRPADARHASRGDQGALRPLERAGRRGACIMSAAGSAAAGASRRRRSRCTPRHPPRPAPRHHRRQPRRRPGPTSWPSWSTPSGRCG